MAQRSRLVNYASHRFDLGVGDNGPEWLLVRDRLSYAERQRLNSAMLDIEITQAGESTAKADPAKYQIAILHAYVVGWQLFDDNGGIVPFTREALDRLDDETAEAVVKHIDEREKAHEEKKAAPPMLTAIEGDVITR